MPEQKDYSGNKLRLKDTVYYVQIDDKGALLDLANRQQFFPDSEAARLLLTLLASKKGGELRFDDLVEYCLKIYDVGKKKVSDEVKTFLADLDNLNLLESTPAKKAAAPDAAVQKAFNLLDKELPKKKKNWPGAKLFGGSPTGSGNAFVRIIVPVWDVAFVRIVFPGW